MNGLLLQDFLLLGVVKLAQLLLEALQLLQQLLVALLREDDIKNSKNQSEKKKS
jgi:hypothetical protein